MTVTSLPATPLELLPRSDFLATSVPVGRDDAVHITVNNFYAPVQVDQFFYTTYQPPPNESPLEIWKTMARFVTAAVSVLSLFCAMLDFSYKQHMDGLKRVISPFTLSIGKVERADEHLRDMLSLRQNPTKAYAAVATENHNLQNAAALVQASGTADLSRRASTLAKAENAFVIGASLHQPDLLLVNKLLAGIQVAATSFESDALRLQNQSAFGYTFNIFERS